MIFYFILKIKPWYDIQYIIPISGMIVANSMTALSLGLKMIDVGHGIEFVGFRQIKDVLQKEGISVPIYLSESNTFPIKSK